MDGGLGVGGEGGTNASSVTIRVPSSIPQLHLTFHNYCTFLFKRIRLRGCIICSFIATINNNNVPNYSFTSEQISVPYI